MPCRHKEHKGANIQQLYGEALVVGAPLIPVWAAVSRATTLTRINFESKAAIDIFIAGFLYHILAEELGVNTWYLTHSHAANNVFSSVLDDSVIHLDMDWLHAAGRASGL